MTEDVRRLFGAAMARMDAQARLLDNVFEHLDFHDEYIKKAEALRNFGTSKTSGWR